MTYSPLSQTSETEPQPTITFYDRLKFALEHLAEPAQLGQESPLAQPYFLGHVPTDPPDVTTNFGRGVALGKVLEQAVTALWEGPLPATNVELLDQALQAKAAKGFCDEYHYLLLDLTYFHRYFPPPAKQSEIYQDVLHVSRATYDRHLREAIRRLGEILLLRLQPTLHVEQPLDPPQLFGRSEILAAALAVLQEKQSVYLCGMSGIGKTALGATVAERWASPTVFWFTVRLTLNDQLTSLLFALGNFLHQQGASRLWLQLIANAGVMKDAHLA
ncbi:MAG: ATP-binding protein, partial [Caldilineaceae bacterium]|nr:ATP-binding protein [Caldilineaceae bacterium]